jgi:hypothetical protein
VAFYETDEFLVDTVSDFVGSSLRDGDAAIVIATAAHRRAFETALNASGIELPAAADRYPHGQHLSQTPGVRPCLRSGHLDASRAYSLSVRPARSPAE